MRTIRSALFMALFPLVTTLMVFLGLPLLLAPRAWLARYVAFWTGLHVRLARWVLGIRLVVEGEVPREPVLVAARHESAYETFALFHLLGDPAVVLKRQIIGIPLFGRLAVRQGVIPVDRTANATALRAMLRAADAVRAQHRPVLIFPEGTRVPHGREARLQPGFAGLYARLDLPVVPVATDAGRVWPRGLRKHAGVVRLRFGAPVPPGLPRREVEARVHAALNVLNP